MKSKPSTIVAHHLRPDSNARSRWSWPCILTLLTLCAFALRWYYVSTAMVIDPIRGDATQYYAYAWNLTHHGVFAKSPPDALTVIADDYRDPGYPFFLAVWMKILGTGGSWYAAVLLCQALLSALTIALVTQLGRLWLPVGWCIGAAVLMTIWPHSVTSPSFLLTETLVGFLCAVAMLAAARAYATTSTAWAVLAGVTFGAAALTNAVLLPFALLLACALAWLRLVSRRIYVALAIGALLLPGAWALRNLTIPPSTVSNSSMGRALQNLVQGSWPNFHSAYIASVRGDSSAKVVMNAMGNEISHMQQSPWSGVQSMLHRFSTQPLHYVAWYAVEKPRLLWGWSIRVGEGDIYTYPTINSPLQTKLVPRLLASLCHGLNLPLMLLALISLAFLWPARWHTITAGPRSNASAALGVACLLVYVTLVYSVLQAEPRYSIPFRSFEILLAATGTYSLMNAWRRYRQTANVNLGSEAGEQPK